MPEPQARKVIVPGEVFKRSVAALTASPLVNKGGIIIPGNYKSFIVNIRPKKWSDNLFWIGQIDDYIDAQFIAEAVYYYTGHPSFHLKNANFKFPPLECNDRGASVLLTDRAMCLKYASSIAKGNEFKSQRSEFRKKVKELALEEVKSVRIQSALLQFRDAGGSAANPAEGSAGNDVDDGDEGVQADHRTPMEVDDHSEQATHFSKLQGPSSHNVPEAVDRNVVGGNVHVPSFGIDGPGFTLQSDWAPVDEFSWAVAAYLGNLKDDDSEDYHESLYNDKGDFCSAMRDLEKSSYGPSVFENFEANFFVMVDAGAVLEDASWKMVV